MNTKLVFSLIFSLLILVGFASAAGLSAVKLSSPASVLHGAGSFTATFNVTYNGTQSSASVGFAGSSASLSGATVTADNVTLSQNQSTTVTATINYPAYQTGSITVNLTANAPGANQTDTTFTVPIANSASLSSSILTSLSASQNGTINITNTGNTALNNINLTYSSSPTSTIPIIFSSNNFALSSTGSRVVTLSSTGLSELKFGSNTITITAQDLVNTSATTSSSFTLSKSFCSSGVKGNNLSLSQIDIRSDGDSDTSWKVLDTITVEIDVENNGGGRVDDVIVEIGLYDTEGRNAIGDVVFSNSDEEQIQVGDLKSGKKETVSFEFKIPADFDTGDYKLAVKAYGDRMGESKECVDYSSDLGSSIYEAVDVDKESDEGKYMVFDNIEVSPTPVICGETATITAYLYNVGDTDEDRVNVRLNSRDLGLSDSTTYYELTSGLDQGSKSQVSFNFVVPQGLSDKTYYIDMNTDYDYRNGYYRQSSDSSTRIPVKVVGCGNTSSATTSSTTTQSGNEIIVTSTIRNSGTTTTTYIVSADGYDSWATLNSISNRLVTLAPGESKQITVSLTPKSTASGEQTFYLQTQAGDKLDRKQVSVNVSGNWLSSLFGSSALVWVIIAVNVILILLIIIVVVRIARR